MNEIYYSLIQNMINSDSVEKVNDDDDDDDDDDLMRIVFLLRDY